MLYVDTSFLICCAEWRVDLVSELANVSTQQVSFPSGVRAELDKLSVGGTARAGYAKLALKFLDNMEELPSEGKVDDWFVRNATPADAVATMDVELRKLLRQKQVPVLIIRQQTYVKLHEGKN